MRPRISIIGFVRPSVCRSVRPSVRPLIARSTRLMAIGLVVYLRPHPIQYSSLSLVRVFFSEMVNPFQITCLHADACVGCFLGSGPDRGRSPVEWGEIPSVRPSVRPSIRPPSGWPSDPAGRPSDPAGWPSDPAGWPSDWLSDPTSWPLDPCG